MKISHNEITGAYYEEKTSWITVVITTLVAMIVLVSLYDLFIGIDTEWVAGVISRDGNE